MCVVCAHVLQHRWRFKWISDPLVWVQISWRCWNVCKTSDALLVVFYKYILILCWFDISLYLEKMGERMTIYWKMLSKKKKKRKEKGKRRGLYTLAATCLSTKPPMILLQPQTSQVFFVLSPERKFKICTSTPKLLIFFTRLLRGIENHYHLS